MISVDRRGALNESVDAVTCSGWLPTAGNGGTQWLDVEGAAALLGLGPQMIRLLTEDGRLSAASSRGRMLHPETLPELRAV